MKALFLSPTVDTAGLGIAMKRAFDQYGGDWTARHVRTENSWLDYPADIQWDRNNAQQTREVERLYAEADLVVIIERPQAAYWFPMRKGLIVWHLGTWYRRQPELVGSQCRAIRALEAVDMHDLMRFGVSTWLPDVIDPVPLRAVRQAEYRWSDRVRIAHAPTDRAIKSTDIIVPVIERIMRRRHQVTFDLIERVPNAECIARKARADIFVDELTLGYGLNALECWSMGQPVVSGIANPATRDAMLRDFDGQLPFDNVTADTLEEELERLILDESYRAAWGRRGAAHVERFHTPQALVRRTIELYEQTLVLA